MCSTRKSPPAPIVLFVYNRLWHAQQTIQALLVNQLASESDLVIYSDGPREQNGESDKVKVQAVRAYLQEVRGMKSVTVIPRAKNWGLAANIISGVSEVVQRYGRVIVLEDDLVTSPYFLQFINDGLEMYQHAGQVASIHGHLYPLSKEQKQLLPATFFLRGADCWGWGTWLRAWNYFEPDGKKLLGEVEKRQLQRLADFNNSYGYTKMLREQIRGRNSSWAIRWYFSAFLAGMLTLYPRDTLVANIGNDGSGTHCGNTDIFAAQVSAQLIPLEGQPPLESAIARNMVAAFFRKKESKWQRLTKKVRKWWQNIF